jgi:hypothetical protein
MLRRDLFRSLLAMHMPGWFKERIPFIHSGVDRQEANAAAIYRGAFGWTIGLPPEDSERLRKAATIAIDDPNIDALVKRASPAPNALREAAVLRRCDWGIEPISADHIGKGHLDVLCIQLVRATCLSARRHAGAQRFREALDDVFAGLTLAHRIGTGGVLFSRLLECGGEVPAFQTLARILPSLDGQALADLSNRLDALPSHEPASATIGPESRFILGSIRTKVSAKQGSIAAGDWADLGFSVEEAAPLRRLTGGDRTALLAYLESTIPVFAELARRLDLPRPGCRAALHDFAQAKRSSHSVVAALVESAWGVRHVVDRMLALRAMLRAGLALIRDGELAFRMVTDPFGTGPFGLVRLRKGYEIRSALKDNGKPEVTLVVGGPP